MSVKSKLKTWVENKIGDKIDIDISESIEKGKPLHIETYAKEIIEDVFNSEELLNLQTKISLDNDLGSDFSYDGNDDDVIGGEGFDVMGVSFDGVSPDEQNVLKELLQAFEFQTVDEVVGQNTWQAAKKTIHKLLTSLKGPLEVQMVALQILKRLVSSSHFPRAVCEGFSTLTEAIKVQVDILNKNSNIVESEELYDIRGSKVYHRSSHRRRIREPIKRDFVDIVTKSIHVALSAQHNFPSVWIRFNERRLHEIIFAFVGMMAHSQSMTKKGISGLEMVAWLQPRANWARHWTHGATARSLFCQALRKHNKFFLTIVEHTLTGIIGRLPGQRKSSAGGQSHGGADKPEETQNILGVSPVSISNARFCHCFSILTYLLQYRAGRALFPLLTSLRRRPWTAYDVVEAMVEYIDSMRSEGTQSPSYLHHLTLLAQILQQVEQEILSSRRSKR